MVTLIQNIASLVTVDTKGKNIKTGSEMREIGEVPNGAILFNESIIATGSTQEVQAYVKENNLKVDEIISADGKTVLPGFVDSHTHIVFSGSRSDEFAKRLRGATYEEIAREGGGIQRTMNATRAASFDELVERGMKLAQSAISLGTTTIEVKSGYGFTTETELRQLQAIRELKRILPIDVVATFLGAHDFPPEYKDNREGYVDLICNEMIPEVADRGLAEFCDAFVDRGYYTLDQADKIMKAAQKHGLKVKMHCDELADVSAAGKAAELGAISADHLLFVSDESLDKMKQSGTIATLLPATAYNIRMPYAPARKIIDKGMAVALATDCNPGSCFTENMQFVLSLAVTNMGMNCEEAISAATINGAAALGRNKSVGSLERGKSADFLICNAESYSDLFYHFGINHVGQAWRQGKLIHKNS